VPVNSSSNTTPTAVVTFGTEQFSPGNRADQNIFEITDNFTIPFREHTFTVGARFETADVYNFFAQTTGGYYIFPSIQAFENLQPSGYRFAFDQSGTGRGIPAEFTTQMWSAYAQDQWAVTPRLTVTAGLRADVPRFADRPLENADFGNVFNTAAGQTLGFNINTSVVPKARVLWSPRIGFNFDPDGRQQNQIRGNVGVYTGNPPYILVANQYQNTGLGLVTVTCSGNNVPAFTTDVSQLRKACANQPEPQPGQFGTAGINLTDPNFKFPQFFGTSLGFDRRLPGSVIFTFEGLYRKAINGLFIRDLNLRGPRMVGGEIYTDRNGRVLYADTISATGSVTNNNQRYITTFKGTNFNEGVIYVTNQSKDYNYSLSGQLRRRFGASLDLSASYTYMQSKDVQSLTSDRAISNWRNGREISGLESEAVATSSYFERPHRVLAYGTWTLPWQLTDVSFIYEIRSGLGLTYTAAGDLNGDLGTTNDPIYIPLDATDPNEIRIGTQSSSGVFTQNAAAAQAFEQFIEGQPCLDKQRGKIMERGSCRSPRQQTMDVAIRQRLPRIQGQQVSLQLDIFNFPNLLNNRWGKVELPRINNNFSQQAVLSVTGRTPGPLDQSQPVFTYNSQVMNNGPWVKLNNTQNNYQLQLTARYAF
jgi:hypothetical protein